MKSTKTVLAVAIVIAGIAFGQEASERTSCTTRSSCSLKGKPKVDVLIEPLPEALKRAGISDAEIKTEVELLLRNVGVPVANLATSDLGLYFLVSGAEVTRASDGRGTAEYYYVLTCDVIQEVRLDRNPSIVVYGATTWKRPGSVVYATSRKFLRDSIAEDIQRATKRFINAYLEANPK